MFSNNILHFKANRENNLRIYCLDSRIRDQGWGVAVKKGKNRERQEKKEVSGGPKCNNSKAKMSFIKQDFMTKSSK